VSPGVRLPVEAPVAPPVTTGSSGVPDIKQVFPRVEEHSLVHGDVEPSHAPPPRPACKTAGQIYQILQLESRLPPA
jgi:hypothetical protein